MSLICQFKYNLNSHFKIELCDDHLPRLKKCFRFVCQKLRSRRSFLQVRGGSAALMAVRYIPGATSIEIPLRDTDEVSFQFLLGNYSI